MLVSGPTGFPIVIVVDAPVMIPLFPAEIDELKIINFINDYSSPGSLKIIFLIIA